MAVTHDNLSKKTLYVQKLSYIPEKFSQISKKQQDIGDGKSVPTSFWYDTVFLLNKKKGRKYA